MIYVENRFIKPCNEGCKHFKLATHLNRDICGGDKYYDYYITVSCEYFSHCYHCANTIWRSHLEEESLSKVAEYCENDVIATEEAFDAIKGDFVDPEE